MDKIQVRTVVGAISIFTINDDYYFIENTSENMWPKNARVEIAQINLPLTELFLTRTFCFDRLLVENTIQSSMRNHEASESHDTRRRTVLWINEQDHDYLQNEIILERSQ